MENIFEIIIYLLLFAVVSYLNIQKEKKKRSAPAKGTPNESPTDIPMPDLFEEIVKPVVTKKTPAPPAAPKEDEVTLYQARLKERGVPTPRVNIPPSREKFENQRRKKINLRKAILYSEIINRRYE